MWFFNQLPPRAGWKQIKAALRVLPALRALALHGALSSDRQVISCSEDGSVRIWELREKQQLSVEPVPTGVYLLSKRWSCFFLMWKTDERQLCVTTGIIYSVLQISMFTWSIWESGWWTHVLIFTAGPPVYFKSARILWGEANWSDWSNGLPWWLRL